MRQHGIRLAQRPAINAWQQRVATLDAVRSRQPWWIRMRYALAQWARKMAQAIQP